jgi:hypothetical protein
MVPLTCDPQEVQVVKDALEADSLNSGVGLLHQPTGRIYLQPMDSLPNKCGHDDLAQIVNVPTSECKGFAVVKSNGNFIPLNLSHLNGPQGQPGSLQMPQPVFDQIVQALNDAGL